MSEPVYNFVAQLFSRFDWNYRRFVPPGMGIVQDKDSFVPEVDLYDGNAGGVAGNNLAFQVYRAQLMLTHAGPPTIIDLSGNTGFMSGAYAVYDQLGRLFSSQAIKGLLINNLGIPDGCGGYCTPPGYNVIIGNPSGSLGNGSWSAPFPTGYGTYNHEGSLGAFPGGWTAIGCPNQDMPVGGPSYSSGGVGSLLELSYGGSPASSADIYADLIIIG